MKKHAICIQCHNKPEIINRIISIFPVEKYDFFIHVDKKSVIREEIDERENVVFVPEIDVKWGRFTQVEATLKLFESVDEERYSYVHLISGSDYPAISPELMFNKMLDDNKEYIQSNRLSENTCTWSCHGTDRYLVWYPQWMIHRPANKIMRIIRVVYREFIIRSKIFTRKKLPTKDFYGGSSWFSITGEGLEWMKKYLEEHKEYTEFFKHGVCADEVFFSTLMRLSPYADRIVNDCKRFMIWEGSNLGGPFVLEPECAHEIFKSGNLWCRKVLSLKTINAIENEWKIYSTGNN